MARPQPAARGNQDRAAQAKGHRARQLAAERQARAVEPVIRGLAARAAARGHLPPAQRPLGRGSGTWPNPRA